MKKFVLHLLVWGIVSNLTAQHTWSLEKCINYAVDHSLSLQQARLNENQTAISATMARQSRLPTLEAGTGLNVSFGRRIDPTSNLFINQQFGFQSLSVSGGALLYGGGRLTAQIRQSDHSHQAAKFDLDQMRNDIALEVAMAFIQVLFALENLELALKNEELTRTQLDQINRLIVAGSRPVNARLELEAQLARNAQSIVETENNVTLTYLDLRQLLQLADGVAFAIERPTNVLPSEYETLTMNSQQVYHEALAWQPNILAGEQRRKVSEMGVMLARTAMLPTVSVGGVLNSNWASSVRDQMQRGFERQSIEGFFINDQPLKVELESPVFSFDKVPYATQVNRNLGYGFGLNVQVPLYNQGRNKNNVKLAELDVVRADVANTQAKNQLRINVERATANALAAHKNYQAAQQTVEALQAAFEDNSRRHALGLINTLEFVTAQNNYERSQIDLLVAKYDFVFKSKVVDFYRGIPLQLN